MKSLNDFKDPFDAITQFESDVCAYTGAPFCITTDCCTHAIEMVFRALEVKETAFPCRTYLSVLMTMHKLGIHYNLKDEPWTGQYQFDQTNVWDSARAFSKDMYMTGTIQCVSFGMTKPLAIGLGGCILTDDRNLYVELSKMRYDGRDIFTYKPWASQQKFKVGYHYYMRPEECILGINMLSNEEFTEQLPEYYNYPDCRNIQII